MFTTETFFHCLGVVLMVHALLFHSSDTFNKLHVHNTIKSGLVVMEEGLAFIVE
jgi:hypothetical protein